MKYTCGLCYPRVKKYLSSIQEGEDHARKHFDRMRAHNDELTEERVHQMCFPRPRLWMEPRPIETIDIDVEPSESSVEHVRESVEKDSNNLVAQPTVTIDIDVEPSSASSEYDVRESDAEGSNNLEAPSTIDRNTKAEFVRKRAEIYARIKKFVRNGKLECRLCRKQLVVIHPSTYFQGQNASRHSENHLGIRFWKCAFCTNAYHNLRNLKVHLVHCHKDLRGDPGGGKIDESLQYSNQILGMLSRCFDHGRPMSSENGRGARTVSECCSSTDSEVETG